MCIDKFKKDKYGLGNLALLILVCCWHAVVPIANLQNSYSSFFGYTYSTLQDYNAQKSASTNVIYVNPVTNVTMIRLSLITLSQRVDRVGLLVIVAIYVLFHIVFIMWMYIFVNKSYIVVLSIKGIF